MLVELHPEMAERDPDEQNPRNAEPHPGNLDLTQRNAERNHHGENQHRMSDPASPERIVPEKQIAKKFLHTVCLLRPERPSANFENAPGI